VDDIHNVFFSKEFVKFIWYNILAELSLFSCVCVYESIEQIRFIGLEMKAFEKKYGDDVTEAAGKRENFRQNQPRKAERFRQKVKRTNFCCSID